MTWKQGRRLASVTNDGQTTLYNYDDDGIRTSKVLQGVEHRYLLNGTQIVAEIWGSNIVIYIYDENGSPIGMQFKGGNNPVYTYFFEKNVFGDIVAVYGSDGTRYVTYSYDAFGNCTTQYLASSTLALYYASYNRLRYRGYYYDTETGFYYVNSRYYDPEICRWINADTPNVLTATPMALTDKNLFAYCDNNPVTREDNGGQFWDTVFDVISLAFSIADVIQDPTDPMNWLGLAADAASLAVPFATGGGLMVDALTKGDDVVDAFKSADNLGELGEVIVKYGDEVKLPNQIKKADVFNAWDDFLGPNQTSYNKFTGAYDPDRIFSADGNRSIRFGNHEMRSIGTTKAHFHYEYWQFDPMSNTVYVKNFLQRLK